MKITAKVFYRFGHLFSISASLGLWYLLLGALPDGLQYAAQAWIDKGNPGATPVVVATSNQAPSEAAVACADHLQPTALTCPRDSL